MLESLFGINFQPIKTVNKIPNIDKETPTGAKEKNEKAFITYITAGLPNYDKTKEIIKAQEKAGTDIIELGIPFSDPTAEGPVIQAANVRALSGGVTTDKILTW